MKSIIALLVYVVVSVSCRAEVGGMRTWTNQEGRNIQAKFVRVLRTKAEDKVLIEVVFKLQSGKPVTIPMASLSEEHQAELREWLGKNPSGMAPPAPPYHWPSQFAGVNVPKVVFVKFDEERKAYLYRTKHFDFYIDRDISKATVSKCVAVFDTIVEALDSLPMQLDTIPQGDRPRHQAILVSNRKTYMQMGGIVNSGGFFSPSRNLTVIPFSSLGIVQKGNKWVFDGKRRSFDTLLHELTHHSTSHWRGMPPWFEEGLADYMESMPYQSGRFLFTSPGKSVAGSVREYRKFTVAAGVIPDGEFQMVHPKKLFVTNRRTWNAAMVSRVASARNYTSSTVLLYYFMHEDGENGAHLIDWLHAWREAVLSRRVDQYDALIEQHLLRGRSYDELEKNIKSAMQRKGLRIKFAN